MRLEHCLAGKSLLGVMNQLQVIELINNLPSLGASLAAILRSLLLCPKELARLNLLLL